MPQATADEVRPIPSTAAASNDANALNARIWPTRVSAVSANRDPTRKPR
jgi:hypothetical protein